jgi:hypothetical protein
MVSFETSFNLKQLKLVRIRNYHYPKQKVCFCSFGSIPKQRVSMHSVIESIFCLVFSVYFGLFQNSLFQFRFYTETESFDVSIEPIQTEDQTKQFDREHTVF